MNTTTEIIRLAESEPLVLTVSALTDFLWPEFVRETKPQVKYLADRFDIRQLSRFGKEVFEFLYTGGDVNPIVSFEDIEQYFRQKQDGQSPSMPKGYKPENGLWNMVLDDIVNSPAYPQLNSLCLGSHFNSGNNSVCILNELSSVMEQMLENNQAALAALTEKAQQLTDIRSKFVKAMKAGDTQTAAELRQQGKELGEEIENALKDVHQEYKPEIDKSIEKAQEEASSIEEAMSALAGDNKGVGVRLTNIEEKNELARKLRTNRRLLAFARRLGALKKAWSQRKRAKKHSSSYSDIVGAVMSDQVTKAYPSEIALAATEAGRALFALKYSERTLLTKDYEAKSKELARGPVVMYVDISGSMSGESELWSKAIAYVIAEECARDNRELQVHLFDTCVDKSIAIKPGSSDFSDLLRFILEWFTHGGTSFDQVMKHAYARADIDPKADVLLITDGECEVTDAVVRKFNTFKDEQSLDVHAFCIGKKSKSLARFCDDVQLVDTSEDADSSELFQKAIA